HLHHACLTLCLTLCPTRGQETALAYRAAEWPLEWVSSTRQSNFLANKDGSSSESSRWLAIHGTMVGSRALGRCNIVPDQVQMPPDDFVDHFVQRFGLSR